MKHSIIYFTAAIIMMVVAGCDNKKQSAPPVGENDSIGVVTPDTAIYGVVGEGTTMHVLELLTEDGKTMTFAVNQDSCSDIQGGIFAGDKVTITTHQGGEDGLEVEKLINLTSLLGKWTSLDRNFEIQEDGIVASSVKAETRPYTQWSMANGNLILNTDTFAVLLLGPDSLTIENDKGIFVYKRQK